eukprot:GILI01040051.1.p1 GENE.GILI01040051.1~~GILI01040051.1.p1  ORF type:complete len:173 (-),score=8.75 GILI01040051.1:27-545(-)
MTKNCWVVVASRDHVKTGVLGGFTQACHGKKFPLGSMKEGEWVVWYSGKNQFESVCGGKGCKTKSSSQKTNLCQKFTAIGQVAPGEIYEAELETEGKGKWTAWRKNIDFHKGAKEVDVRPLISRLKFIRNKEKWGGAFRFGCFRIPQEDMDLIKNEMLAEEVPSSKATEATE